MLSSMRCAALRYTESTLAATCEMSESQKRQGPRRPMIFSYDLCSSRLAQKQWDRNGRSLQSLTDIWVAHDIVLLELFLSLSALEPLTFEL